MADEPILVQSTLKYYIKDFFFSIILVALGLVILFFIPARDSLESSLSRIFPILDAKLHLGLQGYLYHASTLYIPVGLFVMALFVDFSVLLRWRFTWISLEKETVVKKHWFPLKKKAEIKYSSIRTVEVWQSWLGRLIGYGDLVIASGGSQGFDIELSGVSDPDSAASIIRSRQKTSRGGKLTGVKEKYDFF